MEPGTQPCATAAQATKAAVSCRRSAAPAWLFLALTLACLAFVPAAFAGQGSRAGVLSPRLSELAKPSLRDDSLASQARALSLAPEGPGSLLRRGNRVLVDVRVGSGAPPVADLRAAGAEVVNVSRRYRTVTVAAKPAQFDVLSRVAGVVAAQEVLTPVLATSPTGPQAAAVTPCFGAATSEGDLQLQAAEARKAFEVDGSGVTVGILSDSFDLDPFAATDAGADVGSGDLPGAGSPCGTSTPVDVIDEYDPGSEDPEPSDEGRAMAQIVHDLAPGAALAFASAFNGETAFAENIERLAEPPPTGAGAEVIADDVFYFEEPFFQDGPVAVAASKVAGENVAYFSAAGNDNLTDAAGNDIASWEAPAFRDAGECPGGVPSYATHCMDFDPEGGSGNVDTGFGITVEPEETLIIDLQWAQPWNGVTTDFDAYLLRNGNPVAKAEKPNLPFQPVEILGWVNTSSSSRTVTLAIDRCDVACGTERAAANPKLTGTTGGDAGSPRLKFALLENGAGVSAIEYPESSEGDVVGPTIFGHAGAASVVSVGAIPFFSDSAPESYSSHGPVKHYFGPVDPNSVTPAPELKPPEELKKPDLVATDGGANTFFGTCLGHAWRFFGTSAAAPHAAAVAALELEAEPAAGAAEAIDAQKEKAVELPPFDENEVGSGMVDAFAALGQISGTSPPYEAASGPGFAPPDCTAVKKPPVEEEQEKIIPTGVPAEATPSPKRAPSTFFRRHPRRLIRTAGLRATAVFRFGSDASEATFFCRVDGSPIRVCAERFSRRYGEGPHTVRVMARDAEGRVDPTPAVFRFRVERRG